jgi:hypothetical protein
MIERFRYYVLMDHKARWRNDSMCLITSIAWYLISRAAGVESSHAFKVSLGFLIVPFTISTLWYCLKPRDVSSLLEIDLPKRRLLARFAASIVVLVLVGIGTPELEAAIIDTRLRDLLKGEPTQDKIEEATHIVSEANEKKLRASPQLITQLGQKLLESSGKPHLRTAALTAASAFASYRSSLSPLPQARSTPSAVVGLIVFHCNDGPAVAEPPTVTGVPWVKGGPGGFACSRGFIYIPEPISTQGLLPLDGLYARKITFVGGTFFYDGGSLKLESVQFINGSIRVPTTMTENQNVRLFIGAILTGQLITLDLQLPEETSR